MITTDNNKVFIGHCCGNEYKLYGTIVTIDDTTMTASSSELNTTKYSCYKNPNCVLLEDGKVFIGHVLSSSYYLYGTIYFGDHVKQQNGTFRGVAKKSGSEGQTIEVYVPSK